MVLLNSMFHLITMKFMLLAVPLIATHLFAFVLIPIGIYVFHNATTMLKELGATSPILMIIGLAYIMLSICGEIGWHVGQRWFYHVSIHNVLHKQLVANVGRYIYHLKST